MTEVTAKLKEIYLPLVKREYAGLIRSMKLAAAAKEMYPDEVRNELDYGIEVWERAGEEAVQLLQDADEVNYAVLDPVLDILPPNRPMQRFRLEQLTTGYMDLLMEYGGESNDFYIRALAAISRGDHTISANLLDHVLEDKPRHFPALLLRAITHMADRSTVQEAVRVLESAVNLPLSIQPERYKIVGLELLARAYELNDDPANAIKTFKRISNMGFHNSGIDYNVARNYARSRQTSHMFNALEPAVNERPALFALAVIDPDFENMRNEVVIYLQKRSEELEGLANKLLQEALYVVMIAEDYELEREDPSIDEDNQAVRDSVKRLERGSFSPFVRFLYHDLPFWLSRVPRKVQYYMTLQVDAKISEIRESNIALDEKVDEKLGKVLRIGLPIWTVLGIFFFAWLIRYDQPFMAGILVFVLWMLLAYGPFKWMEKSYQKAFRLKRRHPDAIMEVEREIKQVKRTRDQIAAELSKEGIEVKRLYGAVQQKDRAEKKG